jgi:hypothetical protein
VGEQLDERLEHGRGIGPTGVAQGDLHGEERVGGDRPRRIVRLLKRRGLAPDADPAEADPLADEEPLLAALYSASVAGLPPPYTPAGNMKRRRRDRPMYGVNPYRMCGQ